MYQKTVLLILNMAEYIVVYWFSLQLKKSTWLGVSAAENKSEMIGSDVAVT
jgi:hypothetical protein